MADENTNNQNDPKKVLMLPICSLAVAVFLVIYMIATFIAPGLGQYLESRDNYISKKQQYEEISSELEKIKMSNKEAQRAATNSDGVDKEFFRPLEAGVDSESIIAAEFSEILELIKANTIKTRAVRYTYDPEDDNFVKGANGKFSVCKLDMEMIATYTNFKNFMKDLYKHEHYLDIAKIEIVPYQKNKTILIVRLQLKLYAQKV